MILVLFTASYPFDVATEQTFLNEEIKHLAANFEKLVLIPRRCNGTKLPVPPNVEVVEDYFSFLESANKFAVAARVFASPLFYRDLLTHPWLLFNIPSLGRLFAYLGGAYLTRQWLERWLDKNCIDVTQCIFYTYWFDQGTMGIGLAKRLHPDLKLVSRIHGYDLYEERYSPPYWPGRPASFEVTDLLFSAADAGMKYLKERYPAFSLHFEASFLGVIDPGFMSQPSSDGVIRIASCSIIRPVKRVDLLLEGVAYAARQRPDQKIEWRHFGKGEFEGMEEELQKTADEIFPSNARAFFPGYSTQQALMDYYHSNPVDVFFNVSESEGTPVSTMEAISCGIPAVATSVGGNREIVTEQNGLLLSPNPAPQEIADAIFKFADSPEWAASKRIGSRDVWRKKYNADENFHAFIQRLKAIRETGKTL